MIRLYPFIGGLCAALGGLGGLSGAQASPAVTIGGERNLGAELSAVRDLAVLPRMLVVLERSGPHIKVFDHSGRLLQTLGRTGSGPGEFRAPFAVTYDSAKVQLYVVDPANARVTEYEVGDTLRLGRTIATDIVNLVDLCVLSGDLFGLTRSGTEMLHQLAISGNLLTTQRSFGARRTGHPLATHSILQSYVSEGPLLCDNATGTIYVASRLLGELHILTAATGTQQTFAIRDFRPIRFEARAGGGLSLGLPEAGFYEGLIGLAPAPNGVSVVISRYEKGDEIAAYERLDVSRSGTQGSRQPQQWQHIDVTGSMVVCLASNPYPTIAFFRARTCP